MIALGRATSFTIITCVLAWLISSDTALAQTKKITGSGRAIAVLSETKMLPGDDPKHEVSLVRRLDVDKSDVFGEAQVSVVGTSDYVAGSGTHKGYRISTTADGDKVFSAYEGLTKATLKTGGPPDVTFEGKWRFVGGTGKWKGLAGSGTYRGGVTPEGVTYQYEGEYEVKR
jgi:hypothetical protein